MNYTELPRLVYQYQLEPLFGITEAVRKRLGIKPVQEASSRKAKLYDTKLINKKLDELSGIANNEQSLERDWEAELINRAQYGKS